MRTLKGPGIFLGQFVSDVAPFNSWDAITKWASKCGYKGVQIPSWSTQIFDLKKAATSKNYCDEITEIAQNNGVQITELSTHLQGQLIAVHPAYDLMFDGFTTAEFRGSPEKRQRWAVEQLKLAIQASYNLGLNSHATFSGSLGWPFFYPWPQRPDGLIETAFNELAKRWLPLLDFADERGIDICYEIHPGEDLHDGITFEMFLEKVDNHHRANILYDPSHFVLQCLDYLEFIDIYKERIKMFHVKDAEFNSSGRQGVYSGYQKWENRAGRFRSPGDGQVNFGAIFSKMAVNDFPGWAVVEWECAIKNQEDGAREGAEFVRRNIINVTEKTFDDFSASTTQDKNINPQILGLR